MLMTWAAASRPAECTNASDNRLYDAQLTGVMAVNIMGRCLAGTLIYRPHIRVAKLTRDFEEGTGGAQDNRNVTCLLLIGG